jgi:hypothetical protein
MNEAAQNITGVMSSMKIPRRPLHPKAFLTDSLALLEDSDGTMFLNIYSYDEEGTLRRTTIAAGMHATKALHRAVETINKAMENGDGEYAVGRVLRAI